MVFACSFRNFIDQYDMESDCCTQTIEPNWLVDAFYNDNDIIAIAVTFAVVE
jgi:hypothetical protein